MDWYSNFDCYIRAELIWIYKFRESLVSAPQSHRSAIPRYTCFCRQELFQFYFGNILGRNRDCSYSEVYAKLASVTEASHSGLVHYLGKVAR